MSRFDFITTPLAGVTVIERRFSGDERGFFSRLFCAAEFAAAGFDRPVAQINHTLTAKAGTVRGMHFQHPPHAETKVVSCLKGEIFDVVLDLRRGSPTFLSWHGEILSAANGRSILVPEGCAHGFQALCDDCELVYLHTEPYCAEAEGGVHVGDPRLAIKWPLPVTGLSGRDRAHPFIAADFPGVAP